MRKGYCVCLIGLIVLFLAAQGCSSSKRTSVENHAVVKTPPATMTPAKTTAETTTGAIQNCPPAKESHEEKYMSEKMPVSKTVTEEARFHPCAGVKPSI